MSSNSVARPVASVPMTAPAPGSRRGIAWLSAVLIIMPLLLVGAMLLLPRFVRDEHAATGITAATGLYAAGQYSLAAQTLEQEIEQGANAPAVYYNLGMAATQAGDYARAVDALQQARDAAPRDEQIAQALLSARSALALHAASSEPLASNPETVLDSQAVLASKSAITTVEPRLLQRYLSVNEVALIALGAWCVLAWMFVIAMRTARGRGWAIFGAVLAAIVLMALGGAMLV
jgi:tetratricopeptide (TPR) repeat protein